MSVLKEQPDYEFGHLFPADMADGWALDPAADGNPELSPAGALANGVTIGASFKEAAAKYTGNDARRDIVLNALIASDGDGSEANMYG